MNAILALLVVALVATEPAPKITGTLKVPAYGLARLTAENVNPKSALRWRVTPSKGVERATTARERLEFVAPPGSYEVELLVITPAADGALALDEVTATVVIESASGAAPPSKPPTGPASPTGADPRAATVRLAVGGSGCTACVVWPRRSDGRWELLTASHCTGGVGTRGLVTMKDGRAFYVRVTAWAPGPDLAWIVSERDDLGDLPYAYLAEGNAEVDTPVWHNGYGKDRPGNVEYGEVANSYTATGLRGYMLNVSPGDSGGGIFRKDNGKLLGPVCCSTNRGAYALMFAGSPVHAAKLRANQRSLDFGNLADDGADSVVPGVGEDAERHKLP